MNQHVSIETKADLPLKGIKVVEFCHILMGPTVGLVLSELGADVIKIEPVPDGDRTRTLKGHIAGSFSFINRNKRSIGVDLKSDDGKAIVRRLVAEADIATENFGPGTAERIGIGYETLAAINPRIIYCSLKGFLPGPYENRAGLDELAQYMTGLAFMTGPMGQPLRAGTSLNDLGGGLFGVIGILAALWQRQFTGVGQRIHSALYETGAFFAGQHMAGESVTGHASVPFPNRGRSWAIYEIFDTLDERQLFIGITSDKQWRLFCETFERVDLLKPEYSTNEQRRAAYSTLRGIVAEIAKQHSANELTEKLVRIGCPVGLAARPGDLFADPQLNHEDRMSETTLVNGKTVKLPRLPIILSASKDAARANGQVAEFAEHTSEILSELGFTGDEIDKMRVRGSIK